MKKRVLAVLLALTTFATLLTACGSNEPAAETQPEAEQQEEVAEVVEEDEYPEYLNLDSTYPIVKDEYADEITLTAAVLMQDNAGEWEDLWISKYFKEKYNVNLEVEYLTFANYEERKSLMFNSGEMPDMLINGYVTTSDLVKYGASEGVFLQLDQYINETLTPNIAKYFENGAVAGVATAPDGHVYSLPSVSDSENPNSFMRVYMNKAWLDDLGIAMPKTLDEFKDAMYAIKEADPAGVGSENLYPLGGGDEKGFGQGWYILNALGYLGMTSDAKDNYGIAPYVRDGEAVIPVYDMEVYQEYLKIMNQFYTDGIINPTYFTIEETEMNAQANEGRTAVIHNAPFTIVAEGYEDWVSCYPLTSEWQTEAEVQAPAAAGVGNFVVSADTEYPELCMRFADIFYNNEDEASYMLNNGAPAGSEWDFGYNALVWDDELDVMVSNVEDYPEGIDNDWAYKCEYLIGNVWQFGATGLPESKVRMAEEFGKTGWEVKNDWTGQNVYQASIYENMVPYAAQGYPNTTYMDEETSLRLSELVTVIEPYAKEQIALFITGRRPLTETDAFVAELEELGIEELSNIYKDAYATFVGAN